MRVLVIADQESPWFWDHFQKEKLEGIDLILSCGDLKPQYLSFLATFSACPVLYIHGNHDENYSTTPPEGCICIEDTIYTYKGCLLYTSSGADCPAHPRTEFRAPRILPSLPPSLSQLEIRFGPPHCKDPAGLRSLLLPPDPGFREAGPAYNAPHPACSGLPEAASSADGPPFFQWHAPVNRCPVLPGYTPVPFRPVSGTAAPLSMLCTPSAPLRKWLPPPAFQPLAQSLPPRARYHRPAHRVPRPWPPVSPLYSPVSSWLLSFLSPLMAQHDSPTRGRTVTPFLN